MRWRQLLFAHWRVDPSLMSSLLPEGMEVDTFDGSAWIGLIPFLMDDVRFFGLPGLPTVRRFHECNVRTYVLHDGVPGVWFFSLDAASRLAVLGGRNLLNLNYVNARFKVKTEADSVDYRLTRSDGSGARIHWTPGAELPPSESGSLRHFLTERYYLYAGRNERIWRGAVWHEPWTLREVEVHELQDDLIAHAGIETEDGPAFMAADPVDVLGWKNLRVQG
jgi:uncharacterized protein YqjF (DUF2071 family)